MNKTVSLLLLLFLLQSCTLFAYLDKSCGTDGIYKCDDPSDHSTISLIDFVSTVSSCKFIDCPPTLISGPQTNLTLKNVSFLWTEEKLSYGPFTKGVLILSGNAKAVTLQSVTFQNMRVNGNGGAILLLPGANLKISNSQFVNTSATGNGGAIYQDYLSSVMFLNVSFEKTFANGNGGAVYSHFQTRLLWKGGSCANSMAGSKGSCLFTNSDAVVPNTWSCAISNVNFLNGVAKSGGFIYASTTINFMSISNSTFINGRAEIGGGAISASLYTYMILESLYISNCSAGLYGGAFLIADSYAAISMSNIRSCSAGYRGGALRIDNDGYMNIKSTRFELSESLYGGAMSIGLQSLVECSDNSSFISNSAKNGAAFEVSLLGEVRTFNSIFADNRALNDGGAFWTAGGSILIKDSSFTLNFAGNRGAACFASLIGLVEIQGKLVLKSNIALVSGGAFFLKDSIQLSIENSLFTTDGKNYAPKGSLFTLNGDHVDVSYRGVTQTAKTAETIYIESVLLGNYLIESSIAKKLSRLNLFGPPSQLQVIQPRALVLNLTLMDERLPEIVVVAKDVFGNVVQVDPANPIIIQVLLKYPKMAKLFGITAKISLESNGDDALKQNLTAVNAVDGSRQNLTVANDNSVVISFSDLEIFEPKLQDYVFEIRAVKGLASQPVSLTKPWPTFNVSYKLCGGDQELTANLCIQVNYSNPILRYIFGSTSAIFVIITVYAFTWLMDYKDERRIRLQSFSFLGFICMGNVFGFLSVLLTTVEWTRSGECMMIMWLDNIGFTLVFASIFLKLFRLRYLFVVNKSQDAATMLNQRRLLLWLLSILSVTVLYLIVWSILGPSYSSSLKPIASNGVGSLLVISGDRCLHTAYGNSMIFLKLIATLIVSYVSYSIRDVPDELNESKTMGFTVYNWLVFYSLLNGFNETLVSDINAYYIFRSIATVIPHLLTLHLLILMTVRKAWMDKRNHAKKASPSPPPQ